MGTIEWGCAASQRSCIQTTRNYPHAVGRSYRVELNKSESMRARNLIADAKFASVNLLESSHAGPRGPVLRFLSTISVMDALSPCVIQRVINIKLLDLRSMTKYCKLCSHLRCIKNPQWFSMSSFGQWKLVVDAKSYIFMSRYIQASSYAFIARYFSHTTLVACGIEMRTSDRRRNAPKHHVTYFSEGTRKTLTSTLPRCSLLISRGFFYDQTLPSLGRIVLSKL
jgi:hypothetical protein